MAPLIDLLFRPFIAMPLLTIALYFLYCLYRINSTPSYLRNTPWVGKPSGPFAALRANLAGQQRHKELIEEGYNKYSSKDEPFALANLISGVELILPPSFMTWALAQPEEVLNAKIVQHESVQSEYTCPWPEIYRNPIQDHVISRDLTRKLGQMTEVINDEIEESFAECWGTDTELWKEVNVYESVMSVIARTSNRVLIGAPLCRNKKFLYHAVTMAQFIGGIGILLRLFPNTLKPLIAPILTFPIRWHHRKCRQIVAPIIEQRLVAVKARIQDPEAKHPDEPNDMVQWMINMAANSADPDFELNADLLTIRLLAIIFVAVHTSTFTSVHVIFDLISSSPDYKFMELLKAECEEVLASDGGTWTKAGLAKMYRVDSSLRESQRVNGLATIGLKRKVLSRNGVTLPNGMHVPHGATICFPLWGIHHDSGLYPEPYLYNALRYSQQREAFEAEKAQSQSVGAEKSSAIDIEQTDYLKIRNLAMVTTSENHLVFSHGKHACPGRFFAANETKLLLAYMMMKYDIEHQPERTSNSWFGEVHLPPFGANVRVKRRPGTI